MLLGDNITLVPPNGEDSCRYSPNRVPVAEIVADIHLLGNIGGYETICADEPFIMVVIEMLDGVLAQTSR